MSNLGGTASDGPFLFDDHTECSTWVGSRSHTESWVWPLKECSMHRGAELQTKGIAWDTELGLAVTQSADLASTYIESPLDLICA